MTPHVAKFAKFAREHLRRYPLLIDQWHGRPAVYAPTSGESYVVFIARDMRELHQAVMATLGDGR